MKNKTKNVSLIFLTAAMFFISCSSKIMKDKGSTKYKTVKIGDQVWMAENLNYVTDSGSWCYDDVPANCEKYGRLYDWETAMTVCPEGWRLPNKSDYETLLSYFGGDGVKAYDALKEGGSSGFNGVLGGWRTSYGEYKLFKLNANWWSSSKKPYGPWYLDINSEDHFVGIGDYYDDDLGFYVRCLKNN